MVKLNQLPTGISLFAATWIVASPIGWLLSGSIGVAAVTLAAVIVGLAGLATHTLCRFLGGDQPSPLLSMAIGLSTRTVVVFAALAIAFQLGSEQVDKTTLRLFGCSILPFYFSLLASEIRAAQYALAESEAAGAQSATTATS